MPRPSRAVEAALCGLLRRSTRARQSSWRPARLAAATAPTRLAFRTFATVSDFDPATVERATDEVDVCIVGGGPAGLSAAIRLKQLEAEKGREIRVVVLEKGSEVGVS